MHSDNPPRRLSAIDSKVAVLSPPQWTGNCCPPAVADRAKTAASPLPKACFEYLEYRLIVEERVIIVHQHRIRAIVINNVRGDALAEVGLEAVHTHIDQHAQFVAEPPACFGVGKIHQAPYLAASDPTAKRCHRRV